MSFFDKLRKVTRISSASCLKNHWRTRRYGYHSYPLVKLNVHKRPLSPCLTLATISGINSDPLIQQLVTSATVDDIFVVIGTVDVLTPTQISLSFQALDKVTTKQIISTFPWTIHEQDSLLCIQTFLNSETSEIYQPLVQCPHFSRLCQETFRSYSAFSDQELTSVALHLLKLHAAETYSELLAALLVECQNRFAGFDLDCLVSYSKIANYLHRSGFHLAAKIAQVLHQNWEMLNNSESTLVKILQVLSNVGYFCPDDTLCEMQPKLQKMFRQNCDVLTVKTAMSLLESLTRYSSIPMNRTFFVELMEFFSGKADKMTAWELSRVALCIKYSGFAQPDLLEKLFQRANEMSGSGSDLNIAEVVSLLALYDVLNYPGDSKAFLEMHLKGLMDNADVLLLKYIACNSLLVDSSDKDLILAFCRQIEFKFNDLITSLSCFMAVVNHLAKTNYRSISVNRLMSRYLLDQILRHQLGTQPKYVASCSSFLLQSIDRNDLRSMTLLLEKLIYSTPRFTLDDMAHIGMALNKMRNNSFTRSFADQIVCTLARELLIREDGISSFTSLARSVRLIFSKVNVILRNAIAQDLQDLIVKLSPSLNVNTVRSAAYCMAEMKYYLPEVMQIITDIINENSSVVDLPTLAQTFDALGQFQFCPSEMEQLCKITTKRLFDSRTDWNSIAHIRFIIIIASSMASLQIFPEDLISRIFSLEFLSKLDEIIAGAESRSKSNLKSHLKKLNRNVVLQCPHLRIPWFCNDRELGPVFGQAAQARSVAYQQWSNVVYTAMVDVLGGTEFVLQDPSPTSYGHFYNFEYLVDRENNPVPIGSPTFHQRLAVIIATPKSYCANRWRLLGKEQNEVIQLEILGFGVIVIPYFHLNSMMLGDKNSIKQYFHEKLLCRSNEACSCEAKSHTFSEIN